MLSTWHLAKLTDYHFLLQWPIFLFVSHPSKPLQKTLQLQDFIRGWMHLLCPSNCVQALNAMKKCSEETQTLRAGCSKAELKIFTPPQTPFPKFNQLEMVTTFTKPRLVRVYAHNLELSW